MTRHRANRRSYLEPVDGAAVDERRELTHAVAEGVADGAEGDDDVQQLAAAAHEESEQRQRAEVSVLVAGRRLRAHRL